MYSVFTAMSSYVLLSLLIIALILLSLNVWTDQVFSVNGASVSVMCLHITMALPLSVSLVMAESNDLPASSSSGSMDKVKICKLKHIYLILLHIHNRKHQIDFDQTEKIAATAFFVCEYHRFHNGLVVHFLVCQKYFLSDPNVLRVSNVSKST